MRYKAKAFTRHKQGEMNGLERSYALKLEQMKLLGLIKSYKFESVNLKLADKCFYRPDFMVVNANDELEFHETKGKWEDDALVKIKVAASEFPFIFRAFQLIKKQWIERDFTNR